MSQRDTIEDVLQHAVFMGTISEATFERLTVELENLRGAASLRLAPVPELLFYDCHDPTKWPSEREAPKDQASRELDEMLDHVRTLPKLSPDANVFAINMIRTAAERRGRFNDERSRAQIAAYLAHRMPACEERNEAARKRWGAHQRDAWQLHHLGAARARSTKEPL
jgi:hypothetical protein